MSTATPLTNNRAAPKVAGTVAPKAAPRTSRKPVRSALPTRAATAAGIAKPATKATTGAAPAQAPKAAAAPAKAERVKLVRDSFTMPKADFEMIDLLKQRALKQGREVKKSELLRAGLHALAALGETSFGAAVAAVPRLKTGRPHQKKGK
jgi:hypothetical protein